jgi:hypothetical protein
MIRGAFPEAGETSPADLRASYATVLAETLATHAPSDGDPEGIDEGVIAAVREGDVESLGLSEAAGVLALDPERPDAAGIAAEARDILLMGMTTAVLDVEALASAVDNALEPKEIQQKVEGRYPMDLSEYALLHHTIAARAD